MTDLPTTRDEAWRYADIDAVRRLGADALDRWQDLSIAPGETNRQCMIVGGDEPELHRIRIKAGEGARAELFVVIVGSDYARVEVKTELATGAHFEFGGVTIGGGDAVREFVTRTTHDEPEATSNQVVRAVHWGEATGNFLGAINVGRGGQRTDAAQDFKALVLEKGAAANAKPELEIFADDVKCAHGAAIGQMDEMARYYMASRGIAPDLAKKLLVRAFIADALAALEDEGEAERLLEAALDVLDDAGDRIA
ncbi:SufD family Fe-S cluster assembly protein [Aurantiacibacter poecillastricola]|uniref:SufD family Fe-S cluster assembly protein n=1 Tax=Aurantiacibacter poecillastricola TaxID=3064385 RepID=UPI00273E4675|nr:SufD family Fe-S cluster assembly protein [Aurantiacibacter sp. 219JJ12-13]MDP5260552.1 SufD family Fe-S cluster assembly protein [Aurantiacibacter sp. 219JJ12-13]